MRSAEIKLNHPIHFGEDFIKDFEEFSIMTLEDYIRMKDIESHINNIICETFKSLSEVYPNSDGESHTANSKSRIIFPPYSASEEEEKRGELRISEQELRFTFVEVFNEYCKKTENKVSNLRYSVETPTNSKYKFKDTDDPCIDANGISGNMDLVIHDESGERLCLIEFKANNPEPKEIEKDLVKLTNCKEYDKVAKKPIPRYFIGLVKSTKPESTRKSILEKIYNIKKKTKDELNSETVHIKFYNIDKNELLFTEEFQFANDK